MTEEETRKMDMPAPPPAPTPMEEFKVTGEHIIDKIKELVNEGNVRKIIVRHPDGRTMVEFPLTVGVVGVFLLPMWAALGAIIALAADLTIVVEKRA